MKANVRYYLLLAVALLAFSHKLSAQESEFQRPRLVLNTHGPVSPTQAMVFSPDSKFLYAAGDDRVVYAWNVSGEIDLQRTNEPVRTLRWKIARGPRGNIYALAAAPTQSQIAVGGGSALGGTGDISLFAPEQGTVKFELPQQQNGKRLDGHLQKIARLAYSLDGKMIASTSEDGEVRTWQSPEWQSTLLRKAAPSAPGQPPLLTRYYSAIFLDDRTLAVTEPRAGDSGQNPSWQVSLFDARSAPPRRLRSLKQLHAFRVQAIAKAPDSNRWITCDGVGNAFLWSGVADQTPQAIKVAGTGRRPISLAYVRNGLLAVGSIHVDTNSVNPGSYIELWNVSGGSPKRIDEFKLSSGLAYVFAEASPDGNWLAVHCSDRPEILLYRLTDSAGNVKPSPISAANDNAARLAGRAFRSTQVAFTKDLKYLVKLSDADGHEKVVDLTNPGIAAGESENTRWSQVDENALGWQFSQSPDDPQTVRVSRQNVVTQIKLDPIKHGESSCRCFIADEKGEPFAVAIGTRKQAGIFVYSLPAGAGGQARLLRHFRDHRGDVTSLSLSHDAKYLASTATDATVKIWSLSGLRDADSAAWGATFALPGDRVVVKSVLEEGIAAARGLEAGDIIRSVRVGQTPSPLLEQADRIFAAIKNQDLTQGLMLRVEHPGRGSEDIVIVPAWEPMLTLFVDDRDEWALWTPEGYYDSSVAEGSDLFGWQINNAPGETPKILKAEELKKEFERPELIRKLLSAGNMRDADKLAAADAAETMQVLPANWRRHLPNVVLNLPTVKVVEPTSGQRYAKGDTMKVVIRVDYPPQVPPDQFSISAFVGQNKLGPSQSREVVRDGRGWQIETLSWNNIVPPARMNNVLATASQRDGGANALCHEDSVRVLADWVPKPYVLHTLTLAASNYENGLSKLKYCVPDAESLVALLRAREGAHYTLGEIKTLVDDQVTPKNVDAALTSIENRIKATEDPSVLLVSIHGHGTADGPDYYFLPPSMPDGTRESYRKFGISWSQIRRISDFSCRKVVLLDTCYSGNVKLNFKDRSAAKAAADPLKRDQMMVIMATSVDQDALQSELFGGEAFSACLRDALNGMADGASLNETASAKDGDITLMEMATYVGPAVYKLTNKMHRPTFTPISVFEDAEPLKLVHYRDP